MRNRTIKDGPPGETVLQQRIRTRLRELATNPFRAAVENGLKPDVIRSILRPGKAVNPRADTLKDVARALQCSVAYLAGESDSLGPAPPPESQASPSGGHLTIPLMVSHDVAAGRWHEIDDLMQVEPERSPLASDPQWPAGEQYVARVVGDSMNEIYPEGTFVRLVSVFALRGYQPRTGDHVEVARKRDGGLLLELTLKEVRINPDGTIDLLARSTNPRWGEPLRYRDGIDPNDEEAEVKIRGLVTGDFRPRPVRR